MIHLIFMVRKRPEARSQKQMICTSLRSAMTERLMGRRPQYRRLPSTKSALCAPRLSRTEIALVSGRGAAEGGADHRRRHDERTSAFEPVDGPINDRIDGAYREKFTRQPVSRSDDRCSRPRRDNQGHTTQNGSLIAACRGGGDRDEVIGDAELKIDPAQLESYKAAVKGRIETAICEELRVLALYTVAESDHPTQSQGLRDLSGDGCIQVTFGIRPF